jgi:hypothetical protein
MPQPHLLFVVTEDWFFCLHRLSLAVAAKRAGFEVSVATRVAEHGQVIESAGLRLIPLRLSRRSRNPLTEARLIADLVSLYRRERPDIVHHVAMKPVIYGSLAARLTGRRAVVNALTGLGFLFTSDRLSARLLRPWVEAGLGRGLVEIHAEPGAGRPAAGGAAGPDAVGQGRRRIRRSRPAAA